MTTLEYETTGQELGETRQAMTAKLMQYIEEAVSKFSAKREKYYILVHAKPFPNMPNMIKQKLIAMDVKPPMMLSCLLFGVDNQSGTLTLEWALPGDWPTWSVGGTNEPIPEVIASIEKAGVSYMYDQLLPS
jgi:hypothetical protein